MNPIHVLVKKKQMIKLFGSELGWVKGRVHRLPLLSTKFNVASLKMCQILK